MTYQLALTPILDFIHSSEVATMQQTDSAAHKLKPRLFHKVCIIKHRVYTLYASLSQPHRLSSPSVNYVWHYESNGTKINTFFISNMVFFTVQTLESVRTRYTSYSSLCRRVRLEIGLITLSQESMVLHSVWTTTLLIFSALSTTGMC